jgi:hypothetical protein
MSWRLPLGIMAGRGGAASAGSPAAFSPSDIAGLALWLKADEITGLVDDDPVSTWADSSGNSRDATQTSTKRPLYKTAIQNALPAVRFDATDDCLVTAAINFASSTGLTVFVVFTAASATDRVLVESSADSNSNEGAFGIFRLTGNTVSAAHNGHGGLAVAYTTTAATAHTVAVVASSVHDLTLGAGEEVVAWINDGNRAGTKTNSGVNNTDTGFGNHVINIGARNNGASVPSGAV